MYDQTFDCGDVEHKIEIGTITMNDPLKPVSPAEDLENMPK